MSLKKVKIKKNIYEILTEKGIDDIKKEEDKYFLESEVLKIKDEITNNISQVKRDFKNINSEFKSMNSEIKKFIAESSNSIKNCTSSIQKHEKYLKDLRTTNQNVEETLLNVLLAIRQNEYLQAWSPEQKGYPEMKVVGIHPIKIKENTKGNKK